MSAGADVRIIDSHVAFAVEALAIHPYPVPHDAREPVQYVFSDGARRLGLLTDAGDVTQHMRDVLSGVDGLILECNHDAALLAASNYPLSLQRRIAGRLGHLENNAAAGLLRDIDRGRLQHVVAAAPLPVKSEELLLGFHASLRSCHAGLRGSSNASLAGVALGSFHASLRSRSGSTSHASLRSSSGSGSRCRRGSSRGGSRRSSLRLFLLATGGEGNGKQGSNENGLIHGVSLSTRRKSEAQ